MYGKEDGERVEGWDGWSRVMVGPSELVHCYWLITM